MVAVHYSLTNKEQHPKSTTLTLWGALREIDQETALSGEAYTQSYIIVLKLVPGWCRDKDLKLTDNINRCFLWAGPYCLETTIDEENEKDMTGSGVARFPS